MIRFLVRAAVHNPVAIHLATLAVVAAGVLAYFSMPREVFPEFALGTVTVTTVYPGASPDDVEKLVTLKIEDELEGIDGIEQTSSRSLEGISMVTLKIDGDRVMSEFLDDVRAAMSRDLEFPDEVEDPIVKDIKSEFPVIAVFVYGTASEADLRVEAERHKRAIEEIDGVSQVVMNGPRDPELWIEVDPLSLERHGLTLGDIGNLVSLRSRDIPLGALSTPSGEYILRVDADVSGAEDLLDLPVIATPDGRVVRLSQIARVRDMSERPLIRSRFNGEASMYLQVNKKGDGDTIDMSDEVYAYLEEQRKNLPVGVALGTNSDMSIYVQNRLVVMRDSALMGGLLVLISLVFFLNVRVATMTAIGIPVAFLGGIAMAAGFGISLNMISMFSFIVVLGMIVDDAIVVGENIYRHMEEGMDPEEAAILGTSEVGKPVLATILTTMAAFLPMLLLEGQMGMFMRPLPLIVTFCLAASVFEALFVLPVHLAHWTGKRSAAGLAAETGDRWYAPFERLYASTLKLALHYRYITLGLAIALAGTLIGYAGLQMRFNLFDEFESKVFSVNVRAIPGTSMDETMGLVSRIRETVTELPDSELESTNSIAGVSFIDAARFEYGENLGQIWVELREGGGRTRSTAEVIADLRSSFAVPPTGVEKISVVQPQAGPTGAAINLSIRGEDSATLQAIADEMMAFLNKQVGVVDIHDNTSVGKREVRLTLTDSGRQMGFTELGLASELRAAFEGTRFARLRRGDDDVEVIVKLPDELRSQRGSLDEVRVTSPAGGRVPLASVVRFEETTGVMEITRDDGRRSIHVQGDVNKKLVSSKEVTAGLLKEFGDLNTRWPGYELVFEGDEKETNEALEGLFSAGLLAVLVMYFILGTLFKSMTQPFVIMLAIPLAGIGVVIGHLLMQRGLSFMSLIGVLALAGVVVNDSLILIDLVNRRRRAGDSIKDAIQLAGTQRFRPIVLTSATTMLGLSPLTFFASGQARFLQPMAISVFFGLAFATVLILVVVPCAYGILDDLLGLFQRRKPTTASGPDLE
ncbi:MAG: efflux RND transporter permease subunit [Planctomycetota bacterium]|nr:efflux RND transporter permease subunit [Planctomycetota bacterium]MDG2143786.1 efflux RND transporter permease subunit [Planctomycetota bacterium]